MRSFEKICPISSALTAYVQTRQLLCYTSRPKRTYFVRNWSREWAVLGQWATPYV